MENLTGGIEFLFDVHGSSAQDLLHFFTYQSDSYNSNMSVILVLKIDATYLHRRRIFAHTFCNKICLRIHLLTF